MYKKYNHFYTELESQRCAGENGISQAEHTKIRRSIQSVLILVTI